ncbi:MAG: tetratricopeptide repeat protein [Xenococcus sp. (in: cyanobacteria)]
MKITKNSTIVLLTILGILAPFAIDQKILIAQTDFFDPLATPQEDPLLPPLDVKRELTTLEKKRIANTIVEIDQEATNQLAQRNIESAFALWFRQLRLQRALGIAGEITDLGSIGAIAWQENRGAELRIIARRLSVIEQEIITANNLDLELFISLGNAYQQVRYLDRSVRIYEQVLTATRQQDNRESEVKILGLLGELYLAKFDYEEAGIIYEELLTLTKQETNEFVIKEIDQQEVYLLKLVDIYDSSNQPAQAIIIKKQLIEKYAEQEQPEKIASLKISLAADYQAINDLELAQQSYQEAFILAQYLQQIALANETLEKLAILYQNNEQLELAIQTYLQLFDIQEQANNIYALLNICDRLGKLYLLQNNNSQALDFYSRGLEFAQLLNYRTDYFQEQINQVNQQQN